MSSAADLRSAILLDLGRLFSTRRPGTGLLDLEFATTLDFGIPTMTTFNPALNADILSLQAILENAIAIFEPRLSAARARLSAVPDCPGLLVGELTGVISFREVRSPFQALLNLDTRSSSLVLTKPHVDDLR